MSDPRTNGLNGGQKPGGSAPAERHFDDHSVIVPAHNLKAAVKHTLEPGTVAMDVVAQAEAALANLRGEFSGWMNAECERLEAARQTLRQEGANARTIGALFLPSHDIKGAAPTLGFPLAGRMGASLCRLVSHAPDATHVPIRLVDLHVDAIRAVAREQIESLYNPYGTEVSERLSIMVEEFLADELQDAYAEIAADAAPRLAIPEVDG